MFMFSLYNLLFAINLTKKYAQSKLNKDYHSYSRSLSISFIVVILGILLIGVFDEFFP